MSWYVVKFSASDISFGRDVRLRKEFDKFLTKASAPLDMALFSETKGDNTFIYFSPVAARHAMDLVLRYWGVECEKPSATTGLLVGYQNSVNLLR